MKTVGMLTIALLLMAATIVQSVSAQTLTFLFRNGQVIAGPKFQYEVWIKSSNGTTRMGSILVYNNYSTTAFGSNVVANGRVIATKDTAVFGTLYGVNNANDNTASRFAYSWTYLGAPGSGVVIPSTGDGVLAFTVQINIVDITSHAALSLEGLLMNGEEYKDDEVTPWPVVDATTILDDPLPIQLSSFTATVVNPSHVRLDWTTLSETNNYGFEVQKSADSLTSFQTIPNSFIPGHGTTIEPHSYSYLDTVIMNGRRWYRLKQIDLDGTVHYSVAISIEVLTGVKENAIPTQFALEQNYPNPFNPSTRIRYQIPASPAGGSEVSHVTLKVYDVLGREVRTLVNENLQPGSYETTFDARGLASGVYFYQLLSGEFVQTKRMLVMK